MQLLFNCVIYFCCKYHHFVFSLKSIFLLRRYELLSFQSIDVRTPPVTITSGRVFTEILTRIQYVTHRVRVFHANTEEAQSLDIQNTVDIRGTNNFELVMRIESGLKNQEKEFFTDLNGFQVS